MADAPPAASGQRSVTLDIGAIGSGLGDGIDIEEAYRLVATAMENDAELMAAVGAARERAVETVRGNLAAKSARGGLEEYRRALDAAFEDAIDDLTASMGMTASPDQKNTFNSAFDAFAAANASIYKSSADFRRECVDLLAKRALAELGSPVPADFDAQSRISDYIGELSREQAAKTISSLHGLKVSEVLAAGRKRIAQALGELLRRQRAFRELPGLIADGRDMGTVVFPDAPVKIFLDASADERAHRRMRQLQEKGFDVNFERLLSEIKERDDRDRNRAVAPLVPAADALVLDSTELNIEQVIEKALQYAREKLAVA